MPITDDAVLSLFGQINNSIGKLGEKVDGLAEYVARQNGRIGTSEARLGAIEQAGLIATTERNAIVRVANQDRQHNQDVAESSMSRWTKVGIVCAIPVGALTAFGGVIEALHYLALA